MKSKGRIKNIVCISDTHFGSSVALSRRYQRDDGDWHSPSILQTKLWTIWEDFWRWTEDRLKGEPFILVHNGDVIDGEHHRTTTLSSHNLTDQSILAISALEPHVGRAKAYYQIRGTEAHAGPSAAQEELIAKALGAEVEPETGRHSRWEMWMEFAGELIHFSHHIGTTSSTSYESSAPMREIVAAFVEAGQWKGRPPTIVIRSHRHRYIEVKPPNCRIVVTPGFQSKTPFVFKLDRMRAPMFGGIIIRSGNEGVYIQDKIYTVERSGVVTI